MSPEETCDRVCAAALRAGETKIEANGSVARIAKKADERIDVYQVDHDAVFELVGRGPGVKLCDGLFVHTSSAGKTTAVFVELKRGDVDDAYEQLASTFTRLRDCVRRRFAVDEWHAVIVHGKALPRHAKNHERGERSLKPFGVVPRRFTHVCDLRARKILA